jgi:putative membrane protein
MHNPGMFWFGWMWIFPVICCFGIMIFFIFRVFGRNSPMNCFWTRLDREKHSKENNNETALDILKKRYASGEISKDEFERIKKDISNAD